MNRAMALISLSLVGLWHPGFSLERPNGNALQEQYRALLGETEVFDGYRMLKAVDVERFWRSVSDSLAKAKVSAQALKREVSEQHDSLRYLYSQLNRQSMLNQQLSKAGKSITVAGMSIKKSVYITVSLAVAGGLLLLIVTLLVTGKALVKDCLDKRKLYEDLYNDFERYKHQAIEKQIRLSRELQDFRNQRFDLKSA
jgi:hypothetical protein